MHITPTHLVDDVIHETFWLAFTMVWWTWSLCCKLYLMLVVIISQKWYHSCQLLHIVILLYILLYYCIGNLPVSTIPSHMEASHWMSLESWMAVVAQHIYIYSYSAGESFICGISYHQWCGISYHQTNIRPSKDIKQSVFSVPYSIFYNLPAERTIHHVAPHSIL